MRLYERDFTTLTPQEKAEWAGIQERDTGRRILDFSKPRISIRQYTKAVRHYSHLFPNNYLDIVELKDAERLNTQLESFRRLLESTSSGERELCRFINSERCYFIIGSVLAWFQFGHQEAYLFPELKLGSSYEVDYVVVGAGSGGWEFVFVELESPTGRITTKSDELGHVFRKGLSQIEDWQGWLQVHFSSLRETFDKAKRRDMDLPREFTTLDLSRLHFVVVAGRRTDFSDKSYRKRRESQTLIKHYDNLTDEARMIIGADTY